MAGKKKAAARAAGTEQRYLLRVIEGVEPALYGPFSDDLEVMRAAIRFRMRGGDEDGLYRLSVDDNCAPAVESFRGMDFDVVDKWRDVEQDAERQGWTIFERDTPNEHGEFFEIQRIDNPENGHAHMESDIAAWRLVRAEILRGVTDSLYGRAYRLLAELSPKTAYALLRGTFEKAAAWQP